MKEKELTDLIIQKEDCVTTLINLIEKTSNEEVRKKSLFYLIDNFKDDRIIPFLKKNILSEKFRNKNAIFVYALGEYSNCRNELDFLVNLIVTQDYHVAMNAYNIIGDYYPEFDKIQLKNALKIIKDNKNSLKEKEEFIKNVKTFIENELED